ncbi:hypothetical protein QQP08_001914 [Theobroma cacao]|nr:hypothetical protein QQP08_001914 [Theobroma cacao]
MKAQEITVAMVGACLFPTYAFEVVEILSRSGIRVCWNLVGRSRNSDTKSESSSWSIQLDSGSVTFLSTSVFMEVSLVVVLFLDGLSLSRSEAFLVGSELVLEEFVAFDVEFSFFNWEVELRFFFRREVALSFFNWEVELSFFNWEVELSFLSSDLERVESVTAFVELEAAGLRLQALAIFF